MGNKKISLTVNDEVHELDIAPHWTLLEVLREKLGLTGAKEGCGLGSCGACTVLVDGEPRLSCLTLAMDVEGRNVTTIEGLYREGSPDLLQTAFVKHGAVQCGYCTPGMILTSRALLDEKKAPSRGEIQEAISGNLCRCTGYNKIVEAIEAASGSTKPIS